MKKVLVLGKVHNSGLEFLKKKSYEILELSDQNDDYKKALHTIDALILKMTNVDNEFLNLASKLRVIARWSVCLLSTCPFIFLIENGVIFLSVSTLNCDTQVSMFFDTSARSSVLPFPVCGSILVWMFLLFANITCSLSTQLFRSFVPELSFLTSGLIGLLKSPSKVMDSPLSKISSTILVIFRQLLSIFYTVCLVSTSIYTPMMFNKGIVSFKITCTISKFSSGS